MSTFLTAESARLELHDGKPLIRAAVSPPAESLAAEWSVISLVTTLIVDGPGDLGFLMARFGDDGIETPTGWEEAVAASGGSHVQFGTGPAAPVVFARHLTP
ncbi:hypothetical protein [Paractinoplanes maris]|uniref:hypothetical protein n=1 Tax=Paractinoplanes maris TaxID=1734446 RepID=UPI00202039B5|nr:hypothetical protein [Actinoplanes maris]